MVLLIFILTYAPTFVSSLPIAVFINRNPRASNPSYVDDELVFDVSFALVLLVALAITCAWIMYRMTVGLFISWVNRLLGISIALAEQVVDQLTYFRLDTILGIATSALIDANEAGRDFTRPVGGLANPIATTARFAPRT